MKYYYLSQDQLREILEATAAEMFERLQGVEGPEQGLVAATAEQAKRQGAAEDLRERGRVAPGEAEAAIRSAAMMLSNRAAELEKAAKLCGRTRDEWSLRINQREAAWVRGIVSVLRSLLPEPDSGADAPTSPPSLETPTEANP